MAQLSSLHSRILTRTPKASTLMVAQELQDVVIDFFERTRCYQTELAPQDVLADTAEYTITPPANYMLVEPYTVRVNGHPVYPTSEDTLDLQWEELSRGYGYQLYHSSAAVGADSPDWRTATSTDPLYYFMSAKTGKLRLVAIPTTSYTGTNGLIFAGAWKPLIGVTQIDDSIFNDYYQSFIDGALARMFAIPERPWTNPTLAAFHQRRYEDAVAEAEAAVKANQQRASRSVYRSVAYA